jgi:hypothetical protein
MHGHGRYCRVVPRGQPKYRQSRRSQLAEVAHHRTQAPVSRDPAGHCLGVPISRHGGPFGLDGAGLDAEDAHLERSELERERAGLPLDLYWGNLVQVEPLNKDEQPTRPLSPASSKYFRLVTASAYRGQPVVSSRR